MNDNTTHVEKPLTDEGGEVRELTAADMAAFRPLGDVLPELAKTIPTRGKQKAPTNQLQEPGKFPAFLRLPIGEW